MLVGLVMAVALQAAAATPGSSPLVAGVRYDSAIPTLVATVGHDFGEEISSPEQVVAYLEALHQAAPARTHLVEYARSWEGRPLHVLVIASPERIAALDAIRADLRRLADPRTLGPGEAEALVARLPVVTWLMHAVHGNEISSTDAALAEAYHLLAAQGDATVDLILRESIVLIDPLQNPDGRARFVLQHRMARGPVADAEPLAAEHDEPWPGGRSNHYLFDMNRDWFAQSQPETRGRTALFLEWFPHVAVDLHEMGGESTYYFAPPADPLNPYITKAQIGWFDTFGRANAQAFDERGFAYFTREAFDSFYPGYGESWPLFHGAIGMTYEMASARGLVWRRRDGVDLTYRDGVVRHFVAAIETAATAARQRERMLRDFFEFRRTAIDEGTRGSVREYLMAPGHDPSRTDRLARLLAAQGFDVARAEAAFSTGGREFPAGTFVIPAAQPAGRLLRNLMDPHVPQPDAFVAEQDRRRRLRLPNQIYDITAWSLPLAFDVDVVVADRASGAKTVPVTADAPRSSVTLGAAKVGYLMPWGHATATAVAEALAAGVRVRTVDLGFTLEGRRYPAGTALVRTSENDAAAIASFGAIASAHGVSVVAIDSAYVEQGPSLGSNLVRALKSPRVVLGWDQPTSSLSAGWARFVIEQRLGQAVTVVRVASLPRLDLRSVDVIVLPSGNYAQAIGGDMLRRLKDWVQAGGTLVTIGEASRWATRADVGLLGTTAELRSGRPDIEAGDREPRRAEPPTQPIDLEKTIQPERERPHETHGAMLRVALDLDHWLAAGTDGEVQAIVSGSRVLTPITLDKGRNVGVYQVKDRLVAAGLAWPEAVDQLAQKAYLLHQPTGRGHVVAFAEDPNFRAFSAATELLMMNAVLLGPAR